MINGKGAEVDGLGAHGAGRYCLRKSEMAAVVATSGIVAASVAISQEAMHRDIVIK